MHDRDASALTRIIATLGPATSSVATMTKLIEAGVSVFRLNFSHGQLEQHGEMLLRAREASSRVGRPIAVLGDLPGPKIRVGHVPNGGIELESGSKLIFQRAPIEAREDGGAGRIRLSSTYANLVDDAQPGQRLLIADGAVRTLVIDRDGDDLICRVTHGGRLSTGKGINLPETQLTMQTITQRDWACVDWAIDHDLDYLALSFVRSAQDVRDLVAGVAERVSAKGRAPHRLPIIAKIETPPALNEIDAILEAADGMMVARGDLGVEVDFADVPVIQKRLIAAAQDHGKPCIVATQMLESMIEAPAPTRAEANDVAGAIFDQADAVMLSGETAVGRFPVVAVEHMRRIAARTEAHLATDPQPSPPSRLVASRSQIAALAHGVWTVAHDLDAKAIVVWSQAGGGARYLSQNHFRAPIIAATSDERAARRMQLYRGVTSVVMAPPEDLSVFTTMMDEYLRRHGLAQAGETCVLVAGQPLVKVGATNALAIHVVGDSSSGFRV